jgi:hypothetical protein
MYTYDDFCTELASEIADWLQSHWMTIRYAPRDDFDRMVIDIETIKDQASSVVITFTDGVVVSFTISSDE